MVVAADLLIGVERFAVHLGPEPPGLGFGALGHLGIVEEPAALAPIDKGLDEVAAVQVGGADVEMVGGVLGEVGGPVLQGALEAGRVEGRRVKLGSLVSTSGQQRKKQKQGAQGPRGSPDHYSSNSRNKRTTHAADLKRPPQPVKGKRGGCRGHQADRMSARRGELSGAEFRHQALPGCGVGGRNS